jgi:glycosyltransferase involved in cell wall biosynthesis
VRTVTKERLVSVIIPVYNGDRYLAEAIESVLAQTYRPIQSIVVDDGSTDGSARVAERFADSIHYCFQENSGTSAARNRGVDLASGAFLAFLDADDLWTVDKLALQMAAFDADPELDVVFGHVQQFYSPELDASTRERIRCPVEAMPGYLPGTMLIRRASFLRVGPFETDRQLTDATAWYARLLEQGVEALMLADVVLRRRLHGDNKGLREQASQKSELVRVLKASLDRRRAMDRHRLG